MKKTIDKEDFEKGVHENMRKLLKAIIDDKDLDDAECIDEIIKIIDSIKE